MAELWRLTARTLRDAVAARELSATEVVTAHLERYYTWMRSCSRITSTTLPALSLPAGFTPEGLAVGLQLVGRHRGEARLLALAAALEARLDPGAREPML